MIDRANPDGPVIRPSSDPLWRVCRALVDVYLPSLPAYASDHSTIDVQPSGYTLGREIIRIESNFTFSLALPLEACSFNLDKE